VLTRQHYSIIHFDLPIAFSMDDINALNSSSVILFIVFTISFGLLRDFLAILIYSCLIHHRIHLQIDTYQLFYHSYFYLMFIYIIPIYINDHVYFEFSGGGNRTHVTGLMRPDV